MLGLGAAARALRSAARLYRYWRVGVAATGALAAAPALPLLAPGALWLLLAFLALAVRPSQCSRRASARAGPAMPAMCMPRPAATIR